MIYVAKTKVLIGCAADLHLCFHTCKSRFSHDKLKYKMSDIMRKPAFKVSDRVRLKLVQPEKVKLEALTLDNGEKDIFLTR